MIDALTSASRGATPLEITDEITQKGNDIELKKYIIVGITSIESEPLFTKIRVLVRRGDDEKGRR